MDLQYTLEAHALQLKNVPRTLVAVAGVVQITEQFQVSRVRAQTHVSSHLVSTR